MRFFYFYPSFSAPSGGNKQLRLQGFLLTEMGYEVYLLRDSLYFQKTDEFDDDHLYGVFLPVWEKALEFAIHDLKADDVLVLPEGKLNEVLPICIATSARIVINNQNGFYALRYFPENTKMLRRIDAVIANSPYNVIVSRIAYKIHPSKVFYVPHWVVRGDFTIHSDENSSKVQGVCYMPRKLPEMVYRVKEAVLNTFPNVPWIEIDKVPESVVAERLRSHTMFFAAQHLEGCPLTALEAMACRCLVAGFPGTESFSHPYANPRNGYWAEDNCVESAIRAVNRMINDSLHAPKKTRDVLNEGIQTATRYSKEAVTKSLERFTSSFEMMISLQNSDSIAARREVVQEERWNWHDYFFAIRKMHHYGKLTGLTGSIMRAAAKAREAF